MKNCMGYLRFTVGYLFIEIFLGVYSLPRGVSEKEKGKVEGKQEKSKVEEKEKVKADADKILGRVYPSRNLATAWSIVVQGLSRIGHSAWNCYRLRWQDSFREMSSMSSSVFS